MSILKNIVVVLLIIFFLFLVITPFLSSIAMFVGFIPSIVISIIFNLLFCNMNFFPKSSGDMDTMGRGLASSFYVGYLILAILLIVFINKIIKYKKLWLKIAINTIVFIILYVIIQHQAKIAEIPSVFYGISYLFP